MTPGLPKSSPPSLQDLLIRFVNRPVDAASIEAEAGALGEVEPHEVAVGFRVDPRLAWKEGSSALEALGLPSPKIEAPAEWAAVVIRHESVAAQPYGLTSYPQRVRDLSTLLQTKDLSALRAKPESRPATGLRNWAAKQEKSADVPSRLLIAAVLRAANDFDAAEEVLDKVESQSDPSGSIQNERAALLWQRGEWEKAAAIWEHIPDNTVAWFNRGMAALFLDQSAKARECLKKAVAKLPESNGWHHLASLYLALAEIRK